VLTQAVEPDCSIAVRHLVIRDVKSQFAGASVIAQAEGYSVQSWPAIPDGLRQKAVPALFHRGRGRSRGRGAGPWLQYRVVDANSAIDQVDVTCWGIGSL